MNAASPMTLIARAGRFQLYLARKRDRFLMPGLHLWTGSRDRWLVPTARFGMWISGKRPK